MRIAYSALFVLLLPIIVARLLWRSRRAPAYRERLRERLGLFAAPVDERPVIWLHAVSLGETLAAKPLVERILDELDGYQLVITTTTPTGSQQVRRLFGQRVFHVYAPWDTPGAVSRFLKRARPQLLILMETELWPNMLHHCARQGCAVMLANARLSARSAAGYARLPRTTRRMLSQLDWIAAQSVADADHFLQLGMDPARMAVSGNIKFDLRLLPSLHSEARGLRSAWGLEARPTFIFASTHAGEDAIALEAFRRLRECQPRALMLLVPRHPERFEDVARQCSAAGWRVQRRSREQPLTEDVDLLLVDTLGELLLLYGVADVAVVGGSFIPHGGHNPLEAAVWARPILSGSSMFNFAEPTRQLSAAGALEQVDDAESLGARLCALLEDPAQCRRRGDAAAAVVSANRGALSALFGALQRLLDARP
ncbi:MAG: 3-deoxy-D-manno-octulosonic-acid transferase [Halieaceae bacterium]|jgi:3-deoxy-D-manno-octulosonic-acid transferase